MYILTVRRTEKRLLLAEVHTKLKYYQKHLIIDETTYLYRLHRATDWD